MLEDESLNGFRVYWPNGTVGVCSRDADGQSYAQNIQFENLNLMVASASLLESWQVALAHFHHALRPMVNLNMLWFQEPTNVHIGLVTLGLRLYDSLPSC
jgi:hypothetical protein